MKPKRSARAVAAVALSSFLISCTNSQLAGPADAGDAAAPPPRPNIIFVLTDDLAWNLVPYMKNVQQMQQDGLTFSRYFVTDSLCCPSRSSIFTGKYPHDTQVFTNGGNNGGYATYERVGNQMHTFATTLAGVGYQTAMLGKFLNGYSATGNGPDPGWLEWDVADNGYPEFNYTLNRNGVPTPYGALPDEYLVDVMSQIAQNFIEKVAPGPFVIETATFAPHAPYTPAPRYLNTYHEVVPRTPAWNTANMNPPMWLDERQPLSVAALANMDAAFNLRVEAVQAVDDMIGELRAELVAKGLDQNTYVIFSSDNGYHMGDHMLLPGKETAFDTDIRVPLIVVGPGVPAGVIDDRIVENIDLCPTFAELAGAPPPPAVDGHSLVPLFHGENVSDWRNLALVEHVGPDIAPMPPGDPDNEPVVGPPPNSYEAIRTPEAVYVEYVDGELEYYDLEKDPFELVNTAGSLTAAQQQKLHDALTAVKTCHDAATCWAAQHI
jgi:arylsulfatase A-like enzyme